MALNLRNGEVDYQYLHDRINSVEHNAADLCAHFSNYSKRIAQLRDTGDELAESIVKISSKETVNYTLKSVLNRFGDLLAAIQDYRNANAERIDHKIILQLSSYGQICKDVREVLKKWYAVTQKDINKNKELIKTKEKKPTNWQQINQAKHEADRAKSEANEATIQLARKMDDFERNKIENMKKMFLEFVNIELLFHCKAVELYTNAYNIIKEIKVEEDLQEFRNHFKPSYAIGEGNLAFISVSDVTTPNKEINMKSLIETPPQKTLEPIAEDSTTISSSCTDVSLKSSTVDNISVKDANDTQTFKMQSWNH